MKIFVLFSIVGLGNFGVVGNLVKKFDIPMMDVFGQNDQFVQNEKSKEITKFFNNYEIFCHKGKHFVPSSKADIIIFENFLEKYLK